MNDRTKKLTALCGSTIDTSDVFLQLPAHAPAAMWNAQEETIFAYFPCNLYNKAMNLRILKIAVHERLQQLNFCSQAEKTSLAESVFLAIHGQLPELGSACQQHETRQHKTDNTRKKRQDTDRNELC